MADGQLFYIQKAASFHNSMLWWRKGAGYSTDLKEARMFWKSEAEEICSRKNSDETMWPVKYIDARIIHEVDRENCDYEEAKKEIK